VIMKTQYIGTFIFGQTDDCSQYGEAVMVPFYEHDKSWHYKDELPEDYPYDKMFPHSKIIDGVRMFPPMKQ